MPRLLPRLVRWLERNSFDQQSYSKPLSRKPKRLRSLWKPSVQNDASIHYVKGRHQSILLDEGNIINNHRDRSRHKRLPPVVKLHENQKGLIVNHEVVREMSDQEKQWWSSPYLRMLSSPIRGCLLSKRHLPADFMIRLTALKVPSKENSSQFTLTLAPDGLFHPKYANRQYGSGYYIACWKDALDALLKRGTYKRIGKNINHHDLLSEQIGHQLRLRILQELEMLLARLCASPKALKETVVLRKLTQSEWDMLQETNKLSVNDAICVLVVPPLDNDPQTGCQPQPDYSPVPSLDELRESRAPGEDDPPLSVLCKTGESIHDEAPDFLGDEHHPNARVPLYNGISLFPRVSQRAALLQRLNNIIRREKGTKDDSPEDTQTQAFVVLSSPRTLMRADTVPLAISLWRLRMWEGGGWGGCNWIAPLERRPLY